MIHTRLKSRPALASYVLIAMLVVACQVPTEYTQTVGQAMRVTTTGDPQALAEFVKTRAGESLTEMNFLHRITEDGTITGEALFAFGGEPLNINALIRDVEAMDGVQTVVMEPIEHSFRANLITAALHKAIHLEVNITDLTEIELQQVLEDKLKEQGVDGNVKVQLLREGDVSSIMIEAEIPADAEGDDIHFDLKDDNADQLKKQTENVKVIKKGGNN